MSLVAGASALALIGTACGGSDGGGGASAAAEFIPSSAPFFVEVSTDFEGGQWTQAEELISRFPSAPDEGVDDLLRQAFEDEGVDYETQVRPLLGERAVIAATPVVPTNLNIDTSATVNDTTVVAVLELADGTEDDATALLTNEANVTETGEHQGVTIYESSDGDTFVAVTNGALLLADSEATIEGAIDAQRAGGDATLGGTPKFEEALSRLPDDTFGKLYIDLGEFVEQAAAENPGSLDQLGDLGDLGNLVLAASVTTEEDGVRLQGVIDGAPEGAATTAFSPALLSNAPADSIAYIGFANLAGSVSQSVAQLRSADGNEELDQQIDAITGQLPALLGISVQDLGALTSGEHAVVVTDAPAGTPAAALALQTDDGAQASRTLDALRQATPLLAQQAGAALDAEWSPVQLARGVSGFQLPLSPEVNATYGVDGNLAIIGTSPQVVRQVQSPGQSLADDPGFQAATQGMPSEVSGLFWLDPPELIAAADAADAFDASDQEDIATLETFDGIAAWAIPGDVPTFEVFARIVK